MSVTIKEIAKRCQVSVGTVDRALNNRRGISEVTKNKILEVAKSLNYEPNHLAQSLATGSTKTIGVVCINITNPFFSSMVSYIEKIAAKNGYFLNLVLSHNQPEQELEGILYLARRKVDGIIIFPIGKGPDYEKVLKSLSVPIVTIYNRISDEFYHVNIDAKKIMKEAVEMMIGKGYERIVYMNLGIYQSREKNINLDSMEQRKEGYEEGMKEAGLPLEIYEKCSKDMEMDKIFDKEKLKKKTAFLCNCDEIAIKVLNLVCKYGLSCPEDVGIMGFDNIEILNSITPKIYSVDCHLKDVGKQAMDLLFGEMKHKERDIRSVNVDYEITKGESL